MEIHFTKYHGTGNDFIMIDNRSLAFDAKNNSLISRLCHRNFGIGADGLILLEPSDKQDFKMRYFNADGYEGSMCGNGGRCVVAFAKQLDIIKTKTIFEAVDGLHHASIKEDIVTLQMADISDIEKHDTHVFLDTGSPHHVAMIEGLDVYPVFKKGREIRYGVPYYDKGTNVNFVEKTADNHFKMRTYERGVENETLSCGTGATAVAISMFEEGNTKKTSVVLETLGGILEVSFDKDGKGYKNVYLKGKATLVFEGQYKVKT